MKNSNENPVNAGSMADIAFLLLIFFLVSTTIETDVGINQLLPKECASGNCGAVLKENNVFDISLNKSNELLVENEKIQISDLKIKVKEFIDNNKDKSCKYCKGHSVGYLSDNPQKAVISLKTDREASYKEFIAIQNILMEGYHDLRQAYSIKKYGKNIDNLTNDELKVIQKAYPKIISEAEIK